MATISPVMVLLKFYASKLNTAIVDYSEFINYVKKYTQHHVEEQPELIPYLGESDATIAKDLDDLATAKQIILNETTTKKMAIFVINMYVHKYEKMYQEILVKPTLPFPVVADLPKQTPNEILNKQNAADFFPKMLEKQELNDKTLYCLTIPHDVPAVLYPSSFPVDKFVDICLTKIRNMLNKEEYHDYFEKKLRISNPGKEIATRNFFNSLIQTPDQAVKALKETGESFYFFGQLCFFISQDYENIKDFTQEDLNILQAVYIAQMVMAFYKNKLQKNQQRALALESLKENLLKLPYYYSMDTVLGFTDSHGISLRTQYTDKDLKEFLEKETTNSVNNELPLLLVFKISSGTRYFIYKQRVFPLVLRLCSDAHEIVSKHITDRWYATLLGYNKVPEMTDQTLFERELEKEVEATSPVLYALLNANFLTMLAYEMHTSTEQHMNLLFANNQLLPYSDLLMIKRQTLLANAKIMLPFWYAIPIISWLLSLFNKKKTPDTPHAMKKNLETELHHMEEEQDAEIQQASKPVSRRDALASAARKLEKQFVQEGSTIERELSSYSKQWDKIIDTNANANLHEDVDALIRDYMRKVLHTLSGSSFTADRLQILAETLCNTPNMKKIGEHEALLMYVKLYMVQLVKNIR